MALINLEDLVEENTSLIEEDDDEDVGFIQVDSEALDLIEECAQLLEDLLNKDELTLADKDQITALSIKLCAFAYDFSYEDEDEDD